MDHSDRDCRRPAGQAELANYGYATFQTFTAPWVDDRAVNSVCNDSVAPRDGVAVTRSPSQQEVSAPPTAHGMTAMPHSTTGTPTSGAAGSDADLIPTYAGARSTRPRPRWRSCTGGTCRQCPRTRAAASGTGTRRNLTSQAFPRAPQAVRGGSGPEGAWRPYPLTTVRRTASAWSLTARRSELAPTSPRYRPVRHRSTAVRRWPSCTGPRTPTTAHGCRSRPLVGAWTSAYEAQCHGGRTQQWERAVQRAAREATIRNHATGTCRTRTGSATDGAPVRQRRAGCNSIAATARWAYFRLEDGQVVFAQKGSSERRLPLDDWRKPGEGESHSRSIGTTATYDNSPSLHFLWEGDAFGG